MFTTHKSKQEFYDWWKQQDHKAHTCGDMLVYTLMRSYWKEVDVWGCLAGQGIESFMATQVLRAFRKHKRDGYKCPILALEHLKYCLKWPKVRYGYYTFNSVLAACEGQTIHVVTRRLEDVIDQIRNCEEAANGA